LSVRRGKVCSSVHPFLFLLVCFFFFLLAREKNCSLTNLDYQREQGNLPLKNPKLIEMDQVYRRRAARRLHARPPHVLFIRTASRVLIVRPASHRAPLMPFIATSCGFASSCRLFVSDSVDLSPYRGSDDSSNNAQLYCRSPQFAYLLETTIFSQLILKLKVNFCL